MPLRGWRSFRWLSRLKRRLAAELHDHAVQDAARALSLDDLDDVLGGQRLEIEPVGRIVVRRDRLGIAINHDGFEARLSERETGVAAAVIEFDALADAIWAAAEDDDFLFVRRSSFVDGAAGERRLIARIHIRSRRSELGGARVDALEYRPHAELASALRNFFRARPGEPRQPRIGK